MGKFRVKTRQNVEDAKMKMFHCGYGRPDPEGWQAALTISRQIDKTMSESMAFCLDVMKSANFMSLLVGQGAQVAENAGFDAENGLDIADDMHSLAMCPFSELPEHLKVNVLQDDDGMTIVTADISIEGGDGLQVGYRIDINTNSVFVPDDIASLFDRF